MKTPKKYKDLIDNNQVTKEIIGEVLYAINKRAKNWRDKKREYKYDPYGNFEKALGEEQKYYRMKSDILKLFNPILLHKELKKCEYKIYDYDPEFDPNVMEQTVRSYETFDPKYNREVYFYIIDGFKALYYLYYEIGGFSFHEPIEEAEIEKYNLEIKLLEDFETFGKDINDLLSNQFCKKVHDKLINNELEIINL